MSKENIENCLLRQSKKNLTKLLKLDLCYKVDNIVVNNIASACVFLKSHASLFMSFQVNLGPIEGIPTNNEPPSQHKMRKSV